ncbi:DinB family protein [Peristeroidobacter soli]|uniref:DinB family protein n=1 Tax=Peristeroidobacter soli TaxID=2497877 RepID=UPI00101D5E76|nr:DinB family protein [Peristeroidobacter soli]
MNHASHFQLLAEYNRWMNRSVFAAAAKLPADEVTADKGAFFGSILGTLNHLAVADTIWLKRFSTHASCGTSLQSMSDVPYPARLDQTLFADLSSLQGYRERLDELIIQFVAALEDDALDQPLIFSSLKGAKAARNFRAVLMHFFNHQTHHRGQVTTLLFQAGVDPGSTDLLVLVPAEEVGG